MRLARSWRSQLWLIPVLTLIWGAMRWFGSMSGPVRVCDLPGNPLAVRHGHLVFARNDPGRGAKLVVQPARGGRARTLDLSPGHTARGAQVTETHLIYLTSRDPFAPGERPNPAAGQGTSRVYAYELHRLPWSGGSREVEHFQGEPGAVLTPEGCYWWGKRHGENRPLHFLPLLEGEAREIGGGEGMLLGGGSSGGAVVLIPNMTRGERRQSLQVRGQAPPLAVIADVSGVPAAVHVAGRRYWVEHGAEVMIGAEPRPNTEPRPDRIMSSRPDGSDRKIELEAQNRAVEFGQLLGYGEDLYMALAELLPDRMNNGRSVRVVSLCRLRPGDPTAEPKRVCTIPGRGGTCYLDGQDAYFAVTEDRENWWDWSASGLIPQRVTAWYHFRLPAG